MNIENYGDSADFDNMIGTIVFESKAYFNNNWTSSSKSSKEFVSYNISEYISDDSLYFDTDTNNLKRCITQSVNYTNVTKNTYYSVSSTWTIDTNNTYYDAFKSAILSRVMGLEINIESTTDTPMGLLIDFSSDKKVYLKFYVSVSDYIITGLAQTGTLQYIDFYSDVGGMYTFNAGTEYSSQIVSIYDNQNQDHWIRYPMKHGTYKPTTYKQIVSLK